MDVLVKALTLVAIIALGYGIKRVGLLRSTDFRVLAVVAIRITLPCALITSFDAFHVGLDLVWLSVFGLLVILGGQAVCLLVERRRGPRAQAFAVINVPNFNIGLFAMPYLATIIGPQAMVWAAMFDIGNALGAAGLGYAAGMALVAEERPGVWRFVRTMLASPVFVTYVVMLTLGLAGLHLPGPVISFTSTVGAANTFIAMLMIGVGLELALDSEAFTSAFRYLALRAGIVAAALAVLWLVLPVPAEQKPVVSAVLVAPMAAMVSGFTEEAGLDVRVSTFMTTVTVLVAIVAIPVAIGFTT